MADFDINNANDYVPEESTMPMSAIGRGGLSAVNIAGQGSPTAPKLMGGLQGGKTQADLEDTLFSRVRNSESLASAKGGRRTSLEELQAAINMPTDSMNSIEHIARGIAANDRPWDVGAGFQKGVSGAWEAKAERTKQARESAILAAKAGLDFEGKEENIDGELEQTALNNLRGLAKPLMARGAGAGGAGGVRFKTVAGIGLVDTHNVDEQGIPKIVIGDVKMATEIRAKARSIAEKQASDPNHQMVFSNDNEREQFIATRADEITGQMLSGTQPANSAQLPQMRTREQGADALPVPLPGKPVGQAGFPSGTVNDGSRYHVLATELADAQAKGKTADVASLQREIANLPASERAAAGPLAAAAPLAAPVAGTNIPLVPKEGQAAKIKTAEKVAEAQADTATDLKNKAAVGQSVISTVNEIRQLKFNPGAFIKWKQKGGNLLEAFGADGPLARMAAESGAGESLLQGLSNARISLEKGVQTDQDEKRFKAEIVRITDPKLAYEYMLKHMEELGKKSQEHYNFYENYRKTVGKGTSYDGADQAWQKRSSEMGGMVKRYQGGFMGRSAFIDKMVNNPQNLKAYGGDAEKLRQRAEKEWQTLGGGK